MLTLADFVLDKFGGDSIDETRANLEALPARIARAPEAPVGRRTGRRAAAAAADGRPDGEAGSGGDD